MPEPKYVYKTQTFKMDPEVKQAAREAIEMDMGYAPGELPPYEPPSDPKVRAALDELRKADERAWFGI